MPTIEDLNRHRSSLIKLNRETFLATHEKWIDRSRVSQGLIRTIFNVPTISKCLPISFKDGSQISFIQTFCPNCRRVVCDDHFRGITETFDNGLSYIIRGAVVCHSCKSVVRVFAKINMDRSQFIVKDGRWIPKETMEF